MKTAWALPALLVAVAVASLPCRACVPAGIYETGIQITSSINENEIQYLCVGEEVTATFGASDKDLLEQEEVYVDTPHLIPVSGCDVSGPNATCTISFDSPGVHYWAIEADDECLAGNVDDPVSRLVLTFVVLGPDLQADSNNDGTIDESDEAEEEVSPGHLVPYNDDDDNQNNTRDLDEPVDPHFPDDDFASIGVLYQPDENSHEVSTGAEITLSATAGGANVRVWAEDWLTGEIHRLNLPQTYTIGTWAVPPGILVEGCQPGELELTMEYKAPEGVKTCADRLKLTVVRVGLSTDSDNDGDIDSDDDPFEADPGRPGKLVLYNGDDDNENSVPDKDESAWPTNENDAAEVLLHYARPEDLATSSIEINASGVAELRVWVDEQGTREAKTLPLTYQISQGNVPSSIYVEGCSAGRAELTAVLKAATGRVVHSDKVAFTILKIDPTSLGFTGDHDLVRWPSDDPIGKNGSGEDIPVWTTSGSDDDVCYTKNTPPAMFGAFTVVPDITTEVPGIQLRARVKDGSTYTVIGSVSGVKWLHTQLNDSSNADGDVDGIGGGAPLPRSDKVRTLDDTTIEWQASVDNGSSWGYAGVTGPHSRMHYVYTTPLESPLYDLALSKACGYCGGGTAVDAQVATRIRTGIYLDIGGRYSTSGAWRYGTNTLEAYDITDPLICATYANVTAYLNRSVGLSSTVSYVWGGANLIGYRWKYTTIGALVTILVDPGRHGWDWHAIANTAEGESDAALGVEGVEVVWFHPLGSVIFQPAGNYVTSSPNIVYHTPQPLYTWP